MSCLMILWNFITRKRREVVSEWVWEMWRERKKKTDIQISVLYLYLPMFFFHFISIFPLYKKHYRETQQHKSKAEKCQILYYIYMCAVKWLKQLILEWKDQCKRNHIIGWEIERATSELDTIFSWLSIVRECVFLLFGFVVLCITPSHTISCVVIFCRILSSCVFENENYNEKRKM